MISKRDKRAKLWTQQTKKEPRGWQPVLMAMVVSRSLMLAWDVSAEQEEPWRRFLQEISGPRYEEYAGSRRRLGVLAESVWLLAKPSGGGVAIVYLEADNPERVLGELAGSDAPFDSCYSGAMRRLLGFDLTRIPGPGSGELLFAWRDDGPENLPPQSKSGNESR